MPLRLVAASAALIALTASAALSQGTPATRLTEALHQAAGGEAEISLAACSLRVTAETAAPPGAPFARSRVVVQADLQVYTFERVQILPARDRVRLRLDRRPVDERILAQARQVVELGGLRAEQLLQEPGGIAKMLEPRDAMLFFRIMAQLGKDETGKPILVTDKDAPEFYRFATAVEALPPPASYQVTTSFAPGAPSAETFLTGEVIAVPPLQFTVQTEAQAKALAQALHDYAAATGCT